MNHHPRILVAGCGYTGERCADFFSADGADVTGVVSSEESAARLANKPYPVLAVDLADREALRAALGGRPRPDILVHCLSGKTGRDPAAYRMTYVQTLQNLLEILSPAFAVFTGSTSVYAQKDGSAVDENSPVGGTPTGDVLVAAEKLALESGGAVVRLGGIYGPGRSGFIRAALAGEPVAQGDPESFVNLVHRDDAARALQHVATHHLRGAFNAVDDHPSRRSDLARALRGEKIAATADGTAIGKKVSNAKLRATGWTPTYPSPIDAMRADPLLAA